MALSFPCKWKPIRSFFQKQVERYNNFETDYLGFFYGRTTHKTAIVKKAVFGKPLSVPFEDSSFYIAEHCHEYLTQMFGNYMKLPPVEQQVGLHLVKVDFGKY